jgi:serine/threonine protein kinase
METLGEGGVGEVFRAWDNHLFRYVALKRFKESIDVGTNLREEAETLAALQHPNIVTIYDFGSDDHGSYVVMELIEGRTLEEIVTKDGPLSLSMFAELAEQVSRGLAAAHSCSVIHQDLKPGNIMLHHHQDGTFTAKLLDFGMAKYSENIQNPANENDCVIGSVDTIAPEQLRRGPVGVRTDIYSLGCLFYFCLAGRFPYQDKSIEETIEAHLSGSPEPVHHLRTEVPAALAGLIESMMAHEAEDRPESVDKVRRALRAITHLSRNNLSPTQARLQIPAFATTTHRPNRRFNLVLTLIIGILIGIILAVFFMGTFFSRKPIFQTQPSPAQSVLRENQTPTVPRSVWPIVNPLDSGSLKQWVGTQVRVEGVINSFALNDARSILSIKFTETDPKALLLTLSMDDSWSTLFIENLSRLINQPIVAKGEIIEANGGFQLPLSICKADGCYHGEIPCPGPCLKLNSGKWITIPGKSGLWQKFEYRKENKTEVVMWSDHSVGEAIELRNGVPTNIGPCKNCHGKSVVTCGSCKGTGVFNLQPATQSFSFR